MNKHSQFKGLAEKEQFSKICVDLSDRVSKVDFFNHLWRIKYGDEWEVEIFEEEFDA